MRFRSLAFGTACCFLGGSLLSCGSSPVDTSDKEHDAIAAKSGIYCQYVRQNGKTEELELELNAEVARHCGHGRVPSLTQYIVGEVRGIMFCCNKEHEARSVAPAPMPSVAPSPSPTPVPRPSLLPRLPLKRPSPLPDPLKSRRALPPPQKPNILPKGATPPPAQQPAAQSQAQPPAQAPAQTPTPRRPDQDPTVLPSSGP